MRNFYRVEGGKYMDEAHVWFYYQNEDNAIAKLDSIEESEDVDWVAITTEVFEDVGI